jgi:hypothetical protein
MKSKLRYAGHVLRMGETGNAYKINVGKPRRPRGRPRYTREDNIKMDVLEAMYENVIKICMTRDADRFWAPGNTVKNLRDSLKP